jgi:hypothetical protein
VTRVPIPSSAGHRSKGRWVGLRWELGSTRGVRSAGQRTKGRNWLSTRTAYSRSIKRVRRRPVPNERSRAKPEGEEQTKGARCESSAFCQSDGGGLAWRGKHPSRVLGLKRENDHQKDRKYRKGKQWRRVVLVGRKPDRSPIPERRCRFVPDRLSGSSLSESVEAAR